jgi:hypothetical protein
MRLGETEIEFRNPEREEVHIIEVHIHPKHQTGTTHYNVGIAVAGLNLMALNHNTCYHNDKMLELTVSEKLP